jgi:hypothetical protein
VLDGVGAGGEHLIDNQTLEAPRGIPAQFHGKGKNSVVREDAEGEGGAYRRGARVKYRDGSLVD